MPDPILNFSARTLLIIKLVKNRWEINEICVKIVKLHFSSLKTNT